MFAEKKIQREPQDAREEDTKSSGSHLFLELNRICRSIVFLFLIILRLTSYFVSSMKHHLLDFRGLLNPSPDQHHNKYTESLMRHRVRRSFRARQKATIMSNHMRMLKVREPNESQLRLDQRSLPWQSINNKWITALTPPLGIMSPQITVRCNKDESRQWCVTRKTQIRMRRRLETQHFLNVLLHPRFGCLHPFLRTLMWCRLSWRRGASKQRVQQSSTADDG